MDDFGVGLLALGALFVVFASIAFIIGLAIYVVTAIFLMRTFEKMGIAGWKAWIPVYSTWIWLQQGGLPGALALLLLLQTGIFKSGNVDLQATFDKVSSLAGLAVLILTMVATARIAPKFGKPKEYWLLVLIPPVLFGLLASKNAKYQG